MNSLINQWFAEADLNKDGRISPDEARQFFMRSGLDRSVLKQVWAEVRARSADANKIDGLDRRMFSDFLKLVAVIQDGKELQPEIIELALRPNDWLAKFGTPLPAPSIGPAPGPPSAPPATPSQPPTTSPRVPSRRRVPPPPPPKRASMEDDVESTTQQMKSSSLSSGGGSLNLMDAAIVPLAQEQSEPIPTVAESLSAPPTSTTTSPTPRTRPSKTSPKASRPAPVLQGMPSDPAVATTSYTPFESGPPGLALVDFRFNSAPNIGRGQSLMRSLPANHRDPYESPSGGNLVHFDARLPPLDPHAAAKVLFLAAGNGSLWGGPVDAKRPGQLLHWARTEGNMRRPDIGEAQDQPSSHLHGLHHYREAHGMAEDEDNAAAVVCRVTPERVTAVHVDEVDQMMWLGDKKGWVTGFDLFSAPGSLLGVYHNGKVIASSNDYWKVRFQAFKGGQVCALCRSPTGALWVASNKGNVRIFELDWSGTKCKANVGNCRELRRGGLGIGPIMPRAHQRRVMFIVAPANSMVMWTSTVNHMCVWCAFSGLYLGEISKNKLDIRDIRDTVAPDALQKLYQDAPKINPTNGLCSDKEVGSFVSPHNMDVIRAAIKNQRELAAKSDNIIADHVTHLATRGKQIGEMIAKTGGKTIAKVFKNVCKAGTNLIKELQERETKVHVEAAPSVMESVGSGGFAEYDSEAVGESSMSKEEAQEQASMGQLWCVCCSNDGHVWASYSKGVVEQYTSAGQLLDTFRLGSPVFAMCAVGSRMWLGCADGKVGVYSNEAVREKLLKEWQAAESAIVGITAAGTRVYTLTAAGAVKGWGAGVPSLLDDAAWNRWQALTKDAGKACITKKVFKILCATWNVNELVPAANRSQFFGWVQNDVGPNESYQVATFGFQEIEMGTGSVMFNVLMEQTGQKGRLEKGNNNASLWCNALTKALNYNGDRWFQVGHRQLCGILVCVYARTHLKGVIGEVNTARVTTGVMGGIGGNKGAVAVSFTAWRRRITVVSSHFTAHQENVLQRNQNFATVSKGLHFKRHFVTHHGHRVRHEESSGRQDSVAAGGPVNSKLSCVESDSSASDSDREEEGDVEDDQSEVVEEMGEALVQQSEAIRSAEVLVWMGDFNYRINLTFSEAIDYITKREMKALLDKDQLRIQMLEGKAFHGMKEGPIDFLPTYKFDKPKKEDSGRSKQGFDSKSKDKKVEESKGSKSPKTYIYGYDSSEKQRVPSYTDRILFRGSKPFDKEEVKCGDDSLLDEEVIVNGSAAEDTIGLGDVIVTCDKYDSLMQIDESDHKPVYAVIKVEMPVWEYEKKRLTAVTVMKAYYKPNPQPVVQLSAPDNQLHEWRTAEDDSDTSDSDDDDSDSDDSETAQRQAKVRSQGSQGNQGATKLVVCMTARPTPLARVCLTNRSEHPARFVVARTLKTFQGNNKEVQEALLVIPSYGLIPPQQSVILHCQLQYDSQGFDDKIRADFEVLIYPEHAIGGELTSDTLPKYRRHTSQAGNASKNVLQFGVEVRPGNPVSSRDVSAINKVTTVVSDGLRTFAKPYSGL